MPEYILLGFIIAVIVLLILYYTQENFENSREKSQTIRAWFAKNPTPTYANYKKDIESSDIIEYELIKKKLNEDPNTNIENLLN